MVTVNFRITDQTHEWVYGAQGGRYGQWIITFETPLGVQSQIIVTDAQYTPDNVARQIAEQARHIDNVQELTEGPEPVPRAHRRPA